jgi:hypothetical protein
MSESMDKAINQLKDMLSTQEGQKEIEDVLGSAFSQENKALPSNKVNQNPFNMDTFMKIKNIMDKVQADDPRVNLLTSLRPYISQNRSRHIDSAIKIMTLGKLPYLLRDNIKRE